MHGINTNYYKIVHEERRRMASNFFYGQHMARLQRQEQHTPLRIRVSLIAIRYLGRCISKMVIRRAGSHAME
jgi:hypothetical protein